MLPFAPMTTTLTPTTDELRSTSGVVGGIIRSRLRPETIRGDLDQLVRLAAGYASRERFLTELTLDPPQSTSDQSGVPHLDEDYLILSTIHSAKGQEWKAVHVLNVVDGCIPSDMATGTQEELEEERRLCYVGITRAERRLVLTSAARRRA